MPVRQASEALFGRRWRSPYYIVAPRFQYASAGNRVLYTLAHALNNAGEEAYVCAAGFTTGLVWPPDIEGLRAPPLSQRHIDAHLRFARRPIVVYPEINLDTDAGMAIHNALKVRLSMNYLGHFGAVASGDSFDLEYSYSRKIAETMMKCDGVLHVPTADPQFWTPPPTPSTRKNSCMYIGKYVEHHHQPMPREKDHPFVITRVTDDAPNPLELRDIFRRSSHIYIYENTTIAIEAALCGCPVVCRFNPLFGELLSAHETGTDGFVTDDDIAKLGRAHEQIHLFRQTYDESIARFGPALLSFIETTQSEASTGVYDRPFRIGYG